MAFVEAQLCDGEVIVVGGGNASWSGCRVSSGDDGARTHARQVCRFGREHVALPDSANRRDS